MTAFTKYHGKVCTSYTYCEGLDTYLIICLLYDALYIAILYISLNDF